ncbi:HAT repeat protein [Dictyocaulus viviparus]|uniref:Pre-mRNA-splicing factor SYF1 n=1 Tax=Dictyocaulus viviparus TaxID=29172 RepID=A0A0D8Y7H2_DICVI|nr:HAT repeat protein [Dictyocaulus viviparus]
MGDFDKGNFDLSEISAEAHDIAESSSVPRKPYNLVGFFDERSSEDIPYEEDILKNPTSLRSWQRYIDHKKKTNAPWRETCQIYERALKVFDRSYKLWYNYLRFRQRIIAHKPPTDVSWSNLCDAYERCLIHMHKLYPRAREDFVEYLIKIDQLDEAARQLVTLVNEDMPVSDRGKTAHQLWAELCELISKNPKKVHSLDVNVIMRQGIQKYSDQVGVLWCSFAEYYIRAGQFERARDIFEEAMVSVKTVRDFTQIFDAFAAFEERNTATKMDSLSEPPDDEDELELEWLFARNLTNFFTLVAFESNVDIVSSPVALFVARELICPSYYNRSFEIVIMVYWADRFEHLMARRPLLLNSVLLRQNPHNVHEWLNRVNLYEGQPEKQIDTYLEGVRTVKAKLQVGKLSALWISFAKYYENANQIDDARSIFEKATQIPYAKVDELATVWCEYAEMELRYKSPDRAIAVLRRACAPPPLKTNYFDETEAVQHRVHKSLRVWSMYADLEESFGTLDSCRAVYDRILDLRIATPQIVINYAMFLEEHDYFEYAFKAYERGIALFKWPQVYDIWNLYLTKFVSRYGGKKLERARDLFEQCLESCPDKFAKNIFLLYAKLEEDYGLARHAMSIYNRATEAVDRKDMCLMFNIYIKKAQELYGLPHTRPIYEHAICALPEDSSREMSMRYAQMERTLGEIDRARAIFAHASEICDPKIHGQFWETWMDFEIKHGNEDTLREMLRIKRSVQQTFNTSVKHMSAQMIAAGAAKAIEDMNSPNAMQLLEMGSDKQSSGKIAFVRGAGKTTQMDTTENPDEIDVDVGDDDEEEDITAIETHTVPAAVFGDLKRPE